LVAQRAEDQPVAHGVGGPQPRPGLLPAELGVGHAVADGQEAAVERAVEPTGIVHAHLHHADQRVPQPGVVEQHLRGDLADVLAHRLRLFGEVEDDPGEDVGSEAQDRLGDPAQGQKADVVVGVAARIDGVVEGDGAEDVAVAEHDALGPAGRAGGVAEHGQVAGRAQGYLGLEAVRFGGQQVAAQRLHFLERQ